MTSSPAAASVRLTRQGAGPSALRRTAPCAASSSSDIANRRSKFSAGRPVMRKLMVILHSVPSIWLWNRYATTRFPAANRLARLAENREEFMRALRLAVLLLAATFAAPALAEYPDKPIRLIVPQA